MWRKCEEEFDVASVAVDRVAIAVAFRLLDCCSFH